MASLLVYALFGSSRHLAAQATSATAALLASSVAASLLAIGVTGTPDPAVYQAYASAFVLVTGFVFLVAGLARLGFITQFLSKPVMDGFVLGLAIYVMVGQLYKLFGVTKPDGNTVQKLLSIIIELPSTNWATFAVGGGALLLLFLLPRLSRKIPAGIVVLFGAIFISHVFDLASRYGVAVVGALPQGLPSLALPQVPAAAYLTMVLPAMGVLLVAFSEALGVAHEFAEKHGYEVNANQELNAHAAINLASALVGGILAGGSMSASAVKEGAGARSQVANLVTWGLTIATVLFLTPLFAPLPETVLAALIIQALWHIVAARKLRAVRKVTRTEFFLAVLALAGVLLIDVLAGMIIGVVASLLYVVYLSTRPNISVLGRVSGLPGVYVDVSRHADAITEPELLIVRLDGAIYYANALTVRDRIKAMVEEAKSQPRIIIFDCGAQDRLDLTSSDVLKSLVKELQGKGIFVIFADVHVPVREFSRKTGLFDLIGEDHMFPSVELAVQHYAGASPKATDGDAVDNGSQTQVQPTREARS